MKGISLNDFAPAYLSRGVARSQMFDYQGSLEDNLKAIELDPKHVEAYTNLRILKNEMGCNPMVPERA